MRARWTRCVCGQIADIAAGRILARLYPGQYFCRGCGRRTLYCSC